MRLAVLSLSLVAACSSPSIEWGDPVELGGPDIGGLALDSTGHARSAAIEASVPQPASPTICGGSFQAARSPSGRFHAAWWSSRVDSSAALVSAVSQDSGRTWSTPVPVDTQDVTTRGCRRPPPSVATVGDDLQVAYSERAPDGIGVFYAHFMGGMLHEPVAVIYGERLASTSIAAEGDRVAVAYEDPNGSRARVNVAVSSSQGHIFEVRTTASRDVDLASAPSVAMAGHEVAVAWSARRAPDSAATRVVRIGRFP